MIGGGGHALAQSQTITPRLFIFSILTHTSKIQLQNNIVLSTVSLYISYMYVFYTINHFVTLQRSLVQYMCSKPFFALHVQLGQVL